MILQKILLEENDPGQLRAINYIVGQLRANSTSRRIFYFVIATASAVAEKCFSPQKRITAPVSAAAELMIDIE